MKVTFTELLPLDGAGTMISPAYKWLRVDREEFCHHITKAGNLYYMMTREGWVIHSIKVENIKRIEFGCMVADCSFLRGESYPYQVTYTKNGEHLSGQGAKDFSSVLESIRQYDRTYNN